MNSLETLRPLEELAKAKPHGMRLKYLAGCRCLKCRAANSEYQSERYKRIKKGGWNGLVSAEKARKHIEELSKKGIGYKSVALSAGMAVSSVAKIKYGERKNIRALNERAILEVDETCVGEKTLVCARQTWSRLNWLMAEGFTEKELSKRLGYKAKTLQFNKKLIIARNELKVKKFYEMIRAGDPNADVRITYRKNKLEGNRNGSS